MKKNLTKTTRLYRLLFTKRVRGVCRVCGCTEKDPCHNPTYGLVVGCRGNPLLPLRGQEDILGPFDSPLHKHITL